MADIIPLVISYPDFKLNDTIDSEQFDTNNSQIVVKVNEIKDKVNAIVNGTGVTDGSIVTAKIADGAITSAKILDGTIVVGDIADGAITSAKILDGTIATGDIADSAITSAKIADGTIVAGDIADGAITTAKILDGTIATADLADSIITSAKILDGTIVNGDISSTAGIGAAKIATGVVSDAEFITLDGVTSGIQGQLNAKQGLDSTLTALAAYNTNGIVTQTAPDTFAGRSIAGTTNKIVVTNGDGVIGNPTIDVGSDVVTLTGVQTLTNKNVTGTFSGSLTGTASNVTTNANLTGNVTSVGNLTTIPASTITSSMIVDATIVAGDIADGAVTSAKILDGTIVNADINATAGIGATKIATGVVSDAEFITLDGVTSGIQGQLDGKAPLTHVGSGGAAHANAVAGGAAGFITGANQTKLDGIASGAEVNQNTFSTISVSGQTDIVADGKTDTLTIVGSTGITVTTDATTDTLTITATGAATPGAHASSHVTGGTDVIANAVSGGNSGLQSGADKANLDSLVANNGATPYCSATTGTSTAFAATTVPFVTIQPGTIVSVIAHIASTGTAATLNVNGSGDYAIKSSDIQSAIGVDGMFAPDNMYTLRFTPNLTTPSSSRWTIISSWTRFAPQSSPGLTGVPTTPNVAQGTNTSQIVNAAHVYAHTTDYSTHVPYAVVTGSANSYVATLDPAATTLTGMAISININVSNTLTSTLNVNALGAKTILDAAGNALSANALVAGNIYTLRYNGTAFQIQGGGGSDALKANIASPTFTGTVTVPQVNHARNIDSQAQLKDYSETLSTNATATGAVTLDIANGNVFDLTLTGNVTLTFNNPAASGQACSFTMIVRQGATTRFITYPTSVKWGFDVVPDISTVSKTSVITFMTVNGGTRWYGFLAATGLVT